MTTTATSFPLGHRLPWANRIFSSPRTGANENGSIRYRARQQDYRVSSFGS